MDHDTILSGGCSTHTPVVEYDGDLITDDTTCIHIGPDGWDLGKNYDADTAVIGDPRLVLEELTNPLTSAIPADTIQDRLDAIPPIQEQTAPTNIDDPDDPRMSKAELVEVLQDTTPDAYIVDEGVTSKYVMLSRWNFEEASWIGNKGGGLGYGLPAAIGAAIAEQQRDTPRDVIGFIGDGSYLYYPHSIYTAARLDIDITIVIPDNRNYRILKDNMLAIMGGEESDYDFTEMEFDPPVNIPGTAGNFGGEGHLIESKDELADQLDRARNSPGPTVLDVLVHD
jgi:benzoylformate decarboxylase